MTKTQETQIALHEQRITAVAYHVAEGTLIVVICLWVATWYATAVIRLLLDRFRYWWGFYFISHSNTQRTINETATHK